MTIEDIVKGSVSLALKAGGDDLPYLSYCGKCKRWFDSRVGCPTDVAADGAARLAVLEEIRTWLGFFYCDEVGPLREDGQEPCGRCIPCKARALGPPKEEA